MRKCTTGSVVVEGTQHRGTEAIVVTVTRWMIFKIVVASAVVATLLAEMCVTCGLASSRVQ